MCENTFCSSWKKTLQDRWHSNITCGSLYQGAVLKAPRERPQEHRHLLPLYHATVGLKAPNDEGAVPEQRHSSSWKWRQKNQVTRMILFMFLLHVWLENSGTFSNVSMSPHHGIVSGSNWEKPCFHLTNVSNRCIYWACFLILLSCSMWSNPLRTFGHNLKPSSLLLNGQTWVAWGCVFLFPKFPSSRSMNYFLLLSLWSSRRFSRRKVHQRPADLQRWMDGKQIPSFRSRCATKKTATNI